MPASDGATDKAAHVWRFFRAGGFNQVLLSSAEDLRQLPELDQKLWVALSCPASGLEFDEKTLALIDTDKDGRIRVPEILAAVRWACAMLTEPASILKGSDSLPLDAINDATPEGKIMLASARQILLDLGRGDAQAITIADTTDTARIFAQTRFNGDGIVPADASDDAQVRRLITEIIDCIGARTDRSGKPGVDEAGLNAFLAGAKSYSDWWGRAEENASEVLPLGADTAAAASAMQAVRAKIDDYLARCRLAAFDERALPAMNRQESEYLAIAAHELATAAPEIASFPLARVTAEGVLPLSEGINPAWDAAICRFREKVAVPLLGNTAGIAERDWLSVKDKFAAYEAWLAAKSGSSVEPLGIARVREILAQGRHTAVRSLIASGKVLEAEANAISSVDKLVRFHRDLGTLLNNFVSFRAFYQRRDKAVFQVGTLYLDQRSCDLCVRVDDIAKHAAIANLSMAYLAYCELTRKGTGEKMLIAAAFTDGDSDNLMAGRNGIFYDRKGRDWDATIVRIVENPIGIRQAFLAPYKRVIRWIGEQVAKRAVAADAATAGRLETVAGGSARPPEQKPKFDVGVVAALGVAVGGITAALGMLLQAFFGLGFWMPLGLVALVLLISGPSMLIAWLKLHQRNLGPILDANGWAVNTRAKVNIPLGRSLTSVARMPVSAHIGAVDPFAESKSGRRIFAAVVVALAAIAGLWYFGVFEKWIPGVLRKSSWVKNHEAPTQPAAGAGLGSTDSNIKGTAAKP